MNSSCAGQNLHDGGTSAPADVNGLQGGGCWLFIDQI